MNRKIDIIIDKIYNLQKGYAGSFKVEAFLPIYWPIFMWFKRGLKKAVVQNSNTIRTDSKCSETAITDTFNASSNSLRAWHWSSSNNAYDFSSSDIFGSPGSTLSSNLKFPLLNSLNQFSQVSIIATDSRQQTKTFRCQFLQMGTKKALFTTNYIQLALNSTF